jgi:hypothetical protein
MRAEVARLKAELLARRNSPPAKRTPEPFGLAWVRKYLPHYVSTTPSRLHEELAADLAAIAGTRGSHLNRIAPRGSAKTTFASKAYPLWCLLEEVEPFILLLSDSGEQAETFLAAIKEELEGNPVIARAYPRAAGVGPLWQSGRIKARNGVMIAAKGAGGRIRGISRGHRRPTLVVLDDCNEDADAWSETKRRRKLNWLQRGVLPIGEPTTNFVSVGTAVHREAIPCELHRQGGWETKSYRSVIDWPTRMDLWLQWERVYTNLADADRGKAARAFYLANQADMDAGAQVLWPARFPLYDLMERRATMGEGAFRSEYQDEPGTDGATEWPPDYFGDDIWVNTLPTPHERKYTVQALDPSKGAHDDVGDYQAHVVCVLGADGLLYFDADFRREDSTHMATRAADLCDLWESDEIVVETNATMGLLKAEFQQLFDKGRFRRAALHEQVSQDPKQVRIREVGAYLARGQVRVVNGAGGRILVQQWIDWPNGAKDDGPDAAGVAVRRLAN